MMISVPLEFSTANALLEAILVLSSTIITAAYVKCAGKVARSELYRTGKLKAQTWSYFGLTPGAMNVSGIRVTAMMLLSAMVIFGSKVGSILVLGGVEPKNEVYPELLKANATSLKSLDPRAFSGGLRDITRPSVNIPLPGGWGGMEECPTCDQPQFDDPLDPDELEEPDADTYPTPDFHAAGTGLDDDVNDSRGVWVVLSSANFDNCIRYSGTSAKYIRRYSRGSGADREWFCSDTSEYETGGEVEMEVRYLRSTHRGSMECLEDEDALSKRNDFYHKRNRVGVRTVREWTFEILMPVDSETGTICPRSQARYNRVEISTPGLLQIDTIKWILDNNTYYAKDRVFLGFLLGDLSKYIRSWVTEDEVRRYTGRTILELGLMAIVSLGIILGLDVAALIILVAFRKEKINTYNGLSARYRESFMPTGNSEHPTECADLILSNQECAQHIGLWGSPRARDSRLKLA